MSVGSRIRDARIANELTQEQLASLLSISKGAIGNYENDTSYPRAEILRRLCSVLHCDANYIYQDDIKAVADFPVAFPERDLLMKYRSLDEHGRRVVDLLLNEEFSRVAASPAAAASEEEAADEEVYERIRAQDDSSQAESVSFTG